MSLTLRDRNCWITRLPKGVSRVMKAANAHAGHLLGADEAVANGGAVERAVAVNVAPASKLRPVGYQPLPGTASIM